MISTETNRSVMGAVDCDGKALPLPPVAYGPRALTMVAVNYVTIFKHG